VDPVAEYAHREIGNGGPLERVLHGHKDAAVLAFLEVLFGGLESLARIFDERFCVRGAVGVKRLAPEPGRFGTRPVVFLTEGTARG
jgi:hypothetical protein